MKDIDNICKIALVQAEPVMFDKSASLKKALQYIYEAASQKPDLIVRSSNNSQRQPKKRRHTSASDFLSETLLVERSTTAMSFLNRTGHIRYTES